MTHEPAIEETARIASDLIRFDTSNYGEGVSKGETEAAEYLGSLLEGLGLSPQYFDAAPRRTSVVARVPGADSSQPALIPLTLPTGASTRSVA
jgi:acetylornithine deacetylase/succinyl-diaminopimelate desuccinylase-like protein